MVLQKQCLTLYVTLQNMKYNMCHGAYNTGKDIRYKTDNPKHKNAIPYKRAEKHKQNYVYK